MKGQQLSGLAPELAAGMWLPAALPVNCISPPVHGRESGEITKSMDCQEKKLLLPHFKYITFIFVSQGKKCDKWDVWDTFFIRGSSSENVRVLCCLPLLRCRFFRQSVSKTFAVRTGI